LRTIRALSRFDEAPAELAVELTAEGYITRDTQMIARDEAEAAILAVVPEHKADAMTLGDLCRAAGVKRTSGQDAVSRLTEEKRLSRIGRGHRGDPYRYHDREIHTAAATSYERQKETAVGVDVGLEASGRVAE
jgi:hypothetical protein